MTPEDEFIVRQTKVKQLEALEWKPCQRGLTPNVEHCIYKGFSVHQWGNFVCITPFTEYHARWAPLGTLHFEGHHCKEHSGGEPRNCMHFDGINNAVTAIAWIDQAWAASLQAVGSVESKEEA